MNDQLDIEVAEKVMGLSIHHRPNLPLYTKTHADDSLVLKHIVSAWPTHRMNQFWEELSYILAVRHYGFPSTGLVSIKFMKYYEAGDFSLAALRVANHD